jgi:soluble lytic murein transglycosylase-like protein
MELGVSFSDPARDRRHIRRRRFVAMAALAVVAAAFAVLVVRSLDSESSSASVLVPRSDASAVDPLAYDDGQEDDLERAAAFGLSHPLYAKSPGGVLAAAERTASFRTLVEQAVENSGFSADLVEAIVFLESAGRPDVIAGDDPVHASGLTQILAETATNFLGMNVDLAKSRTLTAEIAAASSHGDVAEADRLRHERRSIDARFDPEQALNGTVRYLTEARDRVGRDDLAVVSYHMGIGNLTGVLRAFAGAEADGIPVPVVVEEQGLSWARIFFDSTPERHADAYRLLSRLGDDSPTYYGRVLAAEEIMRLYRDDPDRLRELERLHSAKGSAEEVLHPPSSTQRFTDATALENAFETHTLQTLPNDPEHLFFTVDPTMGELANRLGQPRTLYHGLRAEALALLVYLAARVHEMSDTTQPLEITSSVRDEDYQSLLRKRNPEATAGYSLHTTGYAFDVRRHYESRAQARAFQFMLDDLAARGLIAWVREPAAIHVTVSSDAESLIPSMLQSASSRR